VLDDIGGSRRLAAILAADIAGYSRLMGENEDETVRDLKGHQAVLLPMVGTFGTTARGGATLSYVELCALDDGAVYLQATYPFKKAEQWDLLMRELQPLGPV